MPFLVLVLHNVHNKQIVTSKLVKYKTQVFLILPSTFSSTEFIVLTFSMVNNVPNVNDNY